MMRVKPPFRIHPLGAMTLHPPWVVRNSQEQRVQILTWHKWTAQEESLRKLAGPSKAGRRE